VTPGPIALKIDVDTYVGMRDGVPAIADVLERRGLRASFFVSCGPDHSGRAIRRIFKRGFVGKMLRTNAPTLYGWRTLLYGTLLPGPQIARSFPDLMRRLAAAGHEVGVHGYDHVYWHDRLAQLPLSAVEAELQRGLAVYREIMGADARSFAAPGWQCTEASLVAIEAAGLRYHSDTRGTAPYLPVAGGRRFRTPEIPTTWPTLDEVFGRVGSDAGTLNDFYRGQLQPRLNVHTIHAEVEGMRHRDLFAALLDALLPAVRFVRLVDVAEQLSLDALPRGRVVARPIAGRAGTVATQEAAE